MREQAMQTLRTIPEAPEQAMPEQARQEPRLIAATEVQAQEQVRLIPELAMQAAVTQAEVQANKQ